jgi:hypothetical protein
MKLDPEGELLWSRSVQFNNKFYTTARGVDVDEAGEIVAAGYAVDSTGFHTRPLVMKYGADGDLRFAKLLNVSASTGALEPAIAADGAIFLVGAVSTGNGTGADVVLMKLSPEGAVLANTTLDLGPYDYGKGIALDPLGNVVIAGDTGAYDGMVARFKPDLSLDWSTALVPGMNSLNDVAVDQLGNVVVAGWTYYQGHLDTLVAKFLPIGLPLFLRAIDTGSSERAGGVATSPLGSEVITGGSAGEGVNDPDLVLTRSLGVSALGSIAAVDAQAPDPEIPDLPLPPLP